MAVGGNGIQVPVSLQVDSSEFQSIIDRLKQSVNKLAPDSKLYTGLTKDLQKVEKEADAIKSALAQGFSSPAQLDRFQQKVSNFGEHIRTIAQQISKAHFEDLNLNLVNPDDLHKLDLLKEAVDTVQKRVNNFQTDQMRDMVKQSQAMKDAFSTLKLDVDTTDYTQAMKKANDQIDKLRENAAKKREQTSAKEAALRKAEKAKELRGDLFDIMHQGHQADYTEFFKSNNAWKSQDKKNEFVQLLEEIGIGPKTLQEISNSTGNQIRDFWDRINNEIKAKGLDLKLDNKIKDLQDQLAIATDEEIKANVDLNKVEQLRIALQELNNLDPSSGTEFAQKYQQVQEALQNVIAEYENYKKQVRDAAQLDENSADAIERLTKENRELRAEIEQVKQGLISGAAASREMNASQQQLTNAIKRWFSFREVINLTKRAIKDAINHIKELDATMTQIAVVTNMTQADLWNQIGTYSAIAQQYGVTTNGVYQVSQLYYQQGLQTADVMKLTTETLKMAKIANLDYATSTDYMTVAIRGFKMEMDDAQRVTDVYSRLAAVSASDTEELAVAMSKTASSAEAVGSSFENTSAMIALMVETTREAPENIGSAMKSIISRYGELKISPSKLIDSEGEELSFNKVDAALQSVGVSMHDANGQFREFDEVILDLSKVWRTLDRNTQRYIATVMAGNRQQSRFLALVGDYERLAELTEEAANAQDAGTLQYLKTLDSLETKMNQLKVAFQEFYTSMGLENLFKGALDTLTGFITKLNSLPKLFDTIPVAAMGMGLNLVLAIKNILSLVGLLFYQQFQRIKTSITTITGSKYEIKLSVNKEEFKQEVKQAVKEGIQEGQAEADKNPIDVDSKRNLNNNGNANTAKASWWQNGGKQVIGNAVKLLGNIASTLALTSKDTAEGMQQYGIENSKVASGGAGFVGNILGGALVGGWAGAVIGLVQSIPNIITLFDGLTVSSKELVAQLDKEIEEQKNKVILQKNEVTTLEAAAKKLEELRDHQYESTEAYQEYIDYMNQLGESHSELISRLDEEGNSVIELENIYSKLIKTRANLSTLELQQQELELSKAQAQSQEISRVLDGVSYKTSMQNNNNVFDKFLDIIDVSTRAQQYKEWKVTLREFANLDLNQSQYNNSQLVTRGNYLLNALQGTSIWNTIVGDTNFKTNAKFETEEDLQDYLKQIQQIFNLFIQQEDLIKEKRIQLEEIQKELAQFNNLLNKWANNTLDKSNFSINDWKQLNTFTSSTIVNLLGEQLSINKDNIDNEAQLLWEKYQSFGDDWEQQYLDYYVKVMDYTNDEFQLMLQKYNTNDIYSVALKEIFQKHQQTELIDLKQRLDERTNNYIEKYGQYVLSESQQILKSDYILAIIQNSTAPKYWEQLLTQLYSGTGKYIEQGLYTQAQIYFDNYLNWINSINLKHLDSATQNAILDLFNGVDLTDYDSLNDLINSLKSYDKNNESIDLTDLISSIEYFQENLPVNINTLVNSYIEQLQNVNDAVEKFAKNASKGLSYEDATAELAKLQIDDSSLLFSDVYEFNENVGAFVYTLEGYQKAQTNTLKEYNKKYGQIKTTLDRQSNALFELFNAFTPAGVQFVNPAELSIQANILLEQWRASEQSWDEWYKQQQDELSRGQTELASYREAMQASIAYQLTGIFKEINFEDLLKGKEVQQNTKKLQQFILAAKPELSVLNATELADSYIHLFKLGGQTALNAYKSIIENTPLQFDYDTAKTLYLNNSSQAASAIEELLNAQIGDVISQETAELAAISSGISFDAEHDILIASVDGFLKEAEAIYIQTAAQFRAGQGSLADLNAAYAAYVKGQVDKTEQVLDIISKSAELTIDDLEVYANLTGRELSEVMASKDVMTTGYGKYQLSRSAIAHLYSDNNIEYSSMELMDALSTLNDTAIEYNKKATNKVLEEINNLAQAKVGDQVDVTYLQHLTSNSIRTFFNNTVIGGLATITESTNIPGLIQSIINAGTDGGLLIESDLAALQDTLDQLLKSYADLIAKGISGSLTNVEALDLKNIAKSYLGIDEQDLSFTKTQEGLKLSQDSIVKIYSKLKAVDQVAAHITLENFADELTKSNKQFENISATMSHMSDLQKQIENGEYDNLEAIEAEYTAYADLLQLQRQRADSYSFMDNALPEGLQGPENYWNAVGTAYKAMNESAKSGYMEVQDFYNIVNEMNNLANITGNTLEFMGKDLSGKAEDAANLITWAMQALSNVDGEGVKLDLSELGVNLSDGADSMSKGFDAAINQMADSQIKMLDAEIALLEAIVAMEDLDKVDVKKDGLDVNDIFDTDGFTDNFEDWRTFALKNIEQDERLVELLRSVKVGSLSLYDLFTENAGAIEKAVNGKDNFVKLMSAFYDMSKSGEWNLDDISGSIAEYFSNLDQIVHWTDENGRTYVIKPSGEIASFEIDNAAFQEKIGAAMKALGIEDKIDIQKLVDDWAKGEQLDTSKQIILRVALGEIVVEYDNYGKPTGFVVNGKHYETAEEALVDVNLQEAGSVLDTLNTEQSDTEVTSTYGKKTYTLVNGSEVIVEVDQEGNATYQWAGNLPDGSGQELTTSKQFGSVDEMWQWLGEKYNMAADGQEIDIGAVRARFTGTMDTEIDLEKFYANGADEIKTEISKGLSEGSLTGQQLFDKAWEIGVPVKLTPEGELTGYSKKILEDAVNGKVEDITMNVLYQAAEGSDETVKALVDAKDEPMTSTINITTEDTDGKLAAAGKAVNVLKTSEENGFNITLTSTPDQTIDWLRSQNGVIGLTITNGEGETFTITGLNPPTEGNGNKWTFTVESETKEISEIPLEGITGLSKGTGSQWTLSIIGPKTIDGGQLTVGNAEVDSNGQIFLSVQVPAKTFAAGTPTFTDLTYQDGTWKFTGTFVEGDTKIPFSMDFTNDNVTMSENGTYTFSDGTFGGTLTLTLGDIVGLVAGTDAAGETYSHVINGLLELHPELLDSDIQTTISNIKKYLEENPIDLPSLSSSATTELETYTAGWTTLLETVTAVNEAIGGVGDIPSVGNDNDYGLTPEQLTRYDKLAASLHHRGLRENNRAAIAVQDENGEYTGRSAWTYSTSPIDNPPDNYKYKALVDKYKDIIEAQKKVAQQMAEYDNYDPSNDKVEVVAATTDTVEDFNSALQQAEETLILINDSELRPDNRTLLQQLLDPYPREDKVVEPIYAYASTDEDWANIERLQELYRTISDPEVFQYYSEVEQLLQELNESHLSRHPELNSKSDVVTTVATTNTTNEVSQMGTQVSDDFNEIEESATQIGLTFEEISNYISDLVARITSPDGGYTEEDKQLVTKISQLSDEQLTNLGANNDSIQGLHFILDDINNFITTYQPIDSDAIDSAAQEQISNLAQAMSEIPDVSGTIEDLNGAINTTTSKALAANVALTGINAQLGALSNKTVNVKFNVSADGSVNVGEVAAKGNVALAAGRGTLMGELGPELWVSNGHYYVAGQNGAEFVDLPKDAIVFNHLQTQKLLSSGKAGRGTAVTSETAAVANAAGTTGPAMASAKEALAQLKQIRAMWQALRDASAKDLGSMAGRGGGGGGGGGNDDKFSPNIGDFERWYNWLRQIEKLEQQITLEEAKRQNMRNGYSYSASLQTEIDKLHEEVKVSKELSDLQKEFYDKRRAAQEESMFGQIFTYDEDGLMQYRKGAVDTLLSKLNETDEHGNYTGAAVSAVSQVEYLQKWLKENPRIDENGNKHVADLSSIIIDPETGKKLSTTNEEEAAKIMERFWDEFDGWIDELDGLYDSYNDKLKEIQELIKKENELIQEYVDNQLELEEQIMKAIEDREQATIDAMTKEKDALAKAASDYINGLTNALQKERDMYNQNKDEQETQRLQRQIAILQRSGGSASEIKSLQDQLSDRLQDSYFDAQQKQIDAVKEASDLEIERLERQIEIAQETFDYMKEHGLFYDEVAKILTKTPAEIQAFITSSKDWQALSGLAHDEKLDKLIEQIQMWDADRDKSVGWKEIRDEMLIADETLTPEEMEGYHDTYAEAYAAEWEATKDADKAKAAGKEAVRKKRAADVEEASKPKEETKTETTTPTEPEKPKFEPFTGYLGSGSLEMYEDKDKKSKFLGWFGPAPGVETGKSFTILDFDPATGWAKVEALVYQNGKRSKKIGWANMNASIVTKETKAKLGIGGGSGSVSTPTGGGQTGGGQAKKPGGNVDGGKPSKQTIDGIEYDEVTGEKKYTEEYWKQFVKGQDDLHQQAIGLYGPAYNSSNLGGMVPDSAINNSTSNNNSTINQPTIINGDINISANNVEEFKEELLGISQKNSNRISR